MEGGIYASTPMTARLYGDTPTRDAESSPYRLSELYLRGWWDPATANQLDPAGPAALIAEACTMARPPLRHPWPADNVFYHSIDSLDDERFMRLARFDRDPALYTPELGPFWSGQKALLDADAVATT
jgi:hypothetical protein